MTRAAIQSDLSKHKVVKLSYSVRGHFQIICTTGFGSYFVRDLNKSDSSKLKFIFYDLYSLSPFLKPYKSVDSIDTRYLNQTHALLVNLLKKALDIELYNEK